jgi:hypothetical protein
VPPPPEPPPPVPPPPPGPPGVASEPALPSEYTICVTVVFNGEGGWPVSPWSVTISDWSCAGEIAPDPVSAAATLLSVEAAGPGTPGSPASVVRMPGDRRERAGGDLRAGGQRRRALATPFSGAGSEPAAYWSWPITPRSVAGESAEEPFSVAAALFSTEATGTGMPPWPASEVRTAPTGASEPPGTEPPSGRLCREASADSAEVFWPEVRPLSCESSWLRPAVVRGGGLLAHGLGDRG